MIKKQKVKIDKQNNNAKFKILGASSLLPTLYFLLSGFAIAQTSFTTNLGNFPGGAFTVTMFLNLVRGLTCYFIQLAMIAVAVAFIVYGIMFLKSRGNPQGFGGAKKSLLWGLVGGLVIFGVFTIVLSVADLIGVNYRIVTILNCS